VARRTGGTLKLLLLIIIIIITAVTTIIIIFFRRLRRHIIRGEFYPEAPDRPYVGRVRHVYVLRDLLRYSDTLQNIILYIYVWILNVPTA